MLHCSNAVFINDAFCNALKATKFMHQQHGCNWGEHTLCPGKVMGIPCMSLPLLNLFRSKRDKFNCQIYARCV